MYVFQFLMFDPKLILFYFLKSIPTYFTNKTYFFPTANKPIKIQVSRHLGASIVCWKFLSPRPPSNG